MSFRYKNNYTLWIKNIYRYLKTAFALFWVVVAREAETRDPMTSWSMKIISFQNTVSSTIISQLHNKSCGFLNRSINVSSWKKVAESLTNSQGNFVSTWEICEGERWKIQCTISRKTKVSQESLVETYIFSVSKSGFRRKVERNNWLDNMNFLCGAKVSFQLLRLSILLSRRFFPSIK